MKKWLQRGGAGLLTLVLALAAPAQDKKKDDKKPAAEAIDAEKALKPGAMS